MDPLAEKYYFLSPYAYCSGNPVNFVDPDGKDIWEMDNTGNIINRIEDKEKDAFQMVEKDDDGNWQKKGDSINFEYGTFSENDGIFFSSDENSSADLFAFLASSSIVEYGLIATRDFLYTVFTDGNSNKIDMVKVAHGLEKKGHTIMTMVHSHPQNTIPSGFGRELINDRYIASLYSESNLHQVSHFVYFPKYDGVIQYTYKEIFKKMIPWGSSSQIFK